jgi:uncharacterized membrane protein YhaH (DUF805 family)
MLHCLPKTLIKLTLAANIIKNSLLKWISFIYKGTTYGYSSRRDCLVVFGFLFLLGFVLSFLYSLVGTALNIPPNKLDNHTRDFYHYLIFFTIVANTSLMIMRINDICGKRYITTKIHIFALVVIFFLIGHGGFNVENFVAISI